MFLEQVPVKILIFSSISWLEDVPKRVENGTFKDCKTRSGKDLPRLHLHKIKKTNHTPRNGTAVLREVPNQILSRIGTPVLLLMETARRLLDTLQLLVWMSQMQKVLKNVMMNGRILLMMKLSVKT